MPLKKSLFNKVLYLGLLFTFSSMLLFQNCSKDNNPAAPPDDQSSAAKLDTTINVDAADAYISYQDSLVLRIPQGTVSGDTKLTITKLAESSIPTDTEMDFPDAYEITLGSQHVFDKPLSLTLKYDPEKLNEGKLKYQIGAAYYDETLNRWELFKGVSVDTINNTVSFSTSHLTKLSWWHFKKVLGYTDYTTSPHFIIYWTDGKVPSDADYKSSLTNHKGTNPHYVQDILYYLEEARAAYKKENLTVPTDTTDKAEVRVLELAKGEDGNTSYFGFIRISQNIQKDNDFSQEELVKITCAHELLHYVQDYYYMFTFEGNIIKWWLESTAVQADRIVWPGKSKFEAISYADGSLSGQLERSWDDCNEDPNFYTAGGFLTYLTAYRAGSKLSIPEIIIETGKAKNVSYFRTTLNDYLVNKMSSHGIGSEYRDYVKWAYEHKGPIKIDYIPPLSSTNDKYVVPVMLTETNPTWNGNVTIPYLAAKMVKIISPTSQGATSFNIVLKSQDTQIEQYVYVSDRNQAVYKKYLVKNDTLKINLESKNQWIDILSNNVFKDGSGSFDLSVELVQKPTIISITPNSAAVGTVVQIKGNNFGASQNKGEVWFGAVKALASDIVSWVDTQIDVKVPAGATTGDVHVVVNNINSNNTSFTLSNGAEITNVYLNDTKLEFTAPKNAFTIKGKKFGTSGKVYINNSEISYNWYWSDTSIYVNSLPEDISTGLDSIYIISTSNGQSNTFQFYNGVPLSYLSALDAPGYDILLYAIYGTQSEIVAIDPKSDDGLTKSFNWKNNVLNIEINSSRVTYTYTGNIECTFSADGLKIEKLLINYTFENTSTSSSVDNLEFHYQAKNIPYFIYWDGRISYQMGYSGLQNATVSTSGNIFVRDLKTNEIVSRPFSGIRTDLSTSGIQIEFPPK